MPKSNSYPASQSQARESSKQPSLKRSLSIKERIRYLKENLLFHVEFKYCKKTNDLERMDSLRQSARSGLSLFTEDNQGRNHFQRMSTVRNRRDYDTVDKEKHGSKPRNNNSRPVRSDSGSRSGNPESRSRPVTPEARSRPVPPDARSRPTTPEDSSRPVTPEARSRSVNPDLRDQQSNQTPASSIRMLHSQSEASLSSQQDRPSSRSSNQQLINYRERLSANSPAVSAAGSSRRQQQTVL